MAIGVTTRSAELQAERERYVAGGLYTQPLFVQKAHGARVTDVDGNEYIDFAGGIGTLNGGHTPEAVVAAIKEQADQYLHQCVSVGNYEPYIEVCKRLVRCHPGTGPFKALLQNSGAEAVENAVKIARYATKRPAVICFENGFHGRTLLGMTLTSKLSYKKGMGPFAPEVYRAPGPYPYRGVSGADAVAGFRKMFKNTVDAESVAAIIYEPIQGEGGFLQAPDGFIQEIAGICAEHGILYISDEIQTGMCRTGPVACIEHFGVSPDLAVWGKSMGGGMPISAVTGRADIMDAVHPGGLGGTYGGHPVSCAAAIVALDQALDPDYQAHAAKVGADIRTRLEDLATRIPQIGEVRGIGAMLAMELVTDRETRTPATEMASRLLTICRDRGLIILAVGVYSNVVRVLVPLVADQADLDAGFEILEGALRDAA